MSGEQMTLGEHLRDVGMASTLEAAGPEWAELAFAGIRSLANVGEPFTSETLRDLIGDPPRPNAVGAIFARAAKAGLIVKVGRRPAKRPSLHASELTEWRGK